MHRTADEIRYAMMDTEELRATFMVESLFSAGEIRLTLTDLDRAVIGAAVPTEGSLSLSAPDELRADTFCERRELGVLNIGGAGRVTVDGDTYKLGHQDCLYAGRGTKDIAFASDDAGKPAEFFLQSYPAHTDYPTTLVRQSEANAVALGSDEESNKRTIYQYIHEGGAKSCQLVLGFTELAPGSVWNTMPAHTHERRTEIYTYFDIPEGHRVLHMMGVPDETRALWVHDRSSVLSPAWSIHCGAGTVAYRFIWGMGGENQAFADMDGVPIDSLR